MACAPSFGNFTRKKTGNEFDPPLPDAATWTPASENEYAEKAQHVGILETENEDVRSLRELLIIVLKGIAAYADHAAILVLEDEEVYFHVLPLLRPIPFSNNRKQSVYGQVIPQQWSYHICHRYITSRKAYIS